MRRIGAMLACVWLISACGGANTSSSSAGLVMRLTDNKIALERTSIPSGDVAVTVTNTGSIVHSVDLIKTDIPHDRLPADPKDKSRVQETDIVKSAGQIQPGKSLSFTVRLEPGSYVILCNEPAHYLIGMHVPLTVERR